MDVGDPANVGISGLGGVVMLLVMVRRELRKMIAALTAARAVPAIWTPYTNPIIISVLPLARIARSDPDARHATQLAQRLHGNSGLISASGSQYSTLVEARVRSLRPARG